MKRFFQSIAIAALAFAAMACENAALAPAEKSTVPGEVGNVTISILEKADNSFSLKLVPAEGMASYSFIVTDQAIANPDSSKVYALGYSNIAGSRHKTILAPSWTEYVKDIDSDATYYIYAVGADAANNFGTVASATVKTSDTVYPAIESFQTAENKVLFTFTEDVAYDKTKEVTAAAYAALYLTGAPVIAKTVGTVQTSGNQALVTFDEITTPGSYYVVSFPEGAFVDQVGQPCPALTSYFYSYEDEDGTPSVGVEGYYGSLENDDLVVNIPEGDSIDDLSAWIAIEVPTMVGKVDPKAEMTTIIKHEEKNADGSSSVTYTTVPMKPVTNFKGSLYSLDVRPAGNPQPKDEIYIQIPAGAVMDIYGNENDDIELGPYTFAYTAVYPKVGDYVVNNGQYPFDIKLVAFSDNPEDGYVLYADWFQFFGGWANPVLFLDLDEPNHRLICNDKRVSNGAVVDGCYAKAYYYWDEAQTQLMVFWGGGSGKDPVIITYGDDGLLQTMSYCDYSIHDASGSYLGVADSVADGTTISPKASAAPAKVKAAKNYSPAVLYGNMTFSK